jgi:predicted GNAT superfamily acetyltransferase
MSTVRHFPPQYSIARTTTDLEQILILQQQNLARSIDEETAQKEGFVTVEHDLDVLAAMNEQHAHIVARVGEKIAGYALCMSPFFADTIPVLVPMFEHIHKLNWRGRLINETDYIVMGQVCIAKEWRGRGLFSGLYQQMQLTQATSYPLVLTEIASRNTRSLRAHEKVGFVPIEVYESGGEEWQIVVWDWRQ